MGEEIVLVSRPDQDQAIASLIEAKRGYSLEQLALLSPAQTDEILRDWYNQAADRKLIRLINLWVRALVGDPTPAGVWSWRTVEAAGDVPTVVTYDGAAGTTRATVGALVVLSNEIAGREVLRPGQWIYRLRDAYLQDQARKRQAHAAEENRVAEAKVMDFLTEV
ncbi:MAG: hypothetical protein E6Q97_20000 [Desulfurellales bacterium]|nr:MAG: hypothetical protein E6Q97_20000 [Desulfurellales bacterium]